MPNLALLCIFGLSGLDELSVFSVGFENVEHGSILIA